MDREHTHAAQTLPMAETSTGSVIDPVCGMTVDPEAARASGRHSQYKGVDYFFCSRGCKLDFDEDPERYLDASYTPTM
jgi:YHS domain-containing protein